MLITKQSKLTIHQHLSRDIFFCYRLLVISSWLSVIALRADALNVRNTVKPRVGDALPTLDNVPTQRHTAIDFLHLPPFLFAVLNQENCKLVRQLGRKFDSLS